MDANGRESKPKSKSEFASIGVHSRLKQPVWKDIHRLADAWHGEAQRASPLILIPRFRTTFNRPDWVWQELREGGRLKRYLEIERDTTAQRWRAVGRARARFQQNNKSELRLKASIPAIDYFRFCRMDKDFWKDDANLRALKRDNAHVDTIY